MNTYNLQRECLTDVRDGAGIWQIEGGLVLERRKRIGTYSVARRTSCGTKIAKTTMVWLTIFFARGKVRPENITLHGASDLATSNEFGSVSAASVGQVPLIGHPFERIFATPTSVSSTLTIA